VAQEKALLRAEKEKIHINYKVMPIEEFRAAKQYDAVALIYVHLEPGLRKKFHTEIARSLSPAGYLIFEAFAKNKKTKHPGDQKKRLYYMMLLLFVTTFNICTFYPADRKKLN
jgi:2-polyprenyl-3-methyl-5-hydroxy-6-metoxy-1,4-benzoquinol methylase